MTGTSGAAEALSAAIFDTDGVITRTATVHAAAWTALFDEFLRAWAERTGEPFAGFTPEDYRRFVDGLPRYEGVRRFLESRGITLPTGSPSDPPDAMTVCGLGNRKNDAFLAEVAAHGVEPFDTTLAFVRALREAGVRTAAVSASENCAAILAAAGADGLFDVRVDGLDIRALDLAPKPEPDLFLEAARRLGVRPADAAVVEDALAGVEAARRGRFGLVIGVDRTGHPDDLLAHGADLVVTDLAELRVDADGRVERRSPDDPPSDGDPLPGTAAPHRLPHDAPDR